MKLKLIHNDWEWLDTFAEVITFVLNKVLQKLLVIAIVYKDLPDKQNT